MPSTTSDTSSQTPSVNSWHLNNTTKQHLPWPINRQATSPPCCPPAASHLPQLAAHCLPPAAQCWCRPAPIAICFLVSHPLQSVPCSLPKLNKKVSIICLNCSNSDGNGDNDGSNDGNGQQQWRWDIQQKWWWWWPTAKVTAMAYGNCNGDGNSNKDRNRDGRSRQQRQWLMETATAKADNDYNCNGNRDSDGNRNGYGNGNGNNDCHNNWHKGGLPLHVPAMCGAVAGGTPCLHPCLGTKECALSSAVPSGCHCKEWLLHVRGEGSWELTMDWVLFLFLTTCWVYKKTLCSPTQIQFPQNPISLLLLMVYPGSYCTFCQGKLGWGLQCL